VRVPRLRVEDLVGTAKRRVLEGIVHSAQGKQVRKRMMKKRKRGEWWQQRK
jgi:hypothetical protein